MKHCFMIKEAQQCACKEDEKEDYKLVNMHNQCIADIKNVCECFMIYEMFLEL